MKKYIVNLTKRERKELKKFISQGKKSAWEITRARILLLADEGKKDKEIVEVLGITRQSIGSVRKKYSTSKYKNILEIVKEEPRSGRPIKLDSRVEANTTMIACSDPPEGSVRWTLHMIADKLVKLEVVDSVSHESVRTMLKKTS